MLEKKMKLKELRQYLRSDKINLYIQREVPIKFELWGYDNKTNKLAEYRYLEEVDERENDMMFLDYGDYFIDEIGTEEDGDLYIRIYK